MIKNSNAIQKAAGIIPVAASAALTYHFHPVLLAGLFLAAYIAMLFMPVYKKRRLAWLFLLVFVFSIPLNIHIILLVNPAIVSACFMDIEIIKYFSGFMIFCILLSIEEIALCVILNEFIVKGISKLITKSENKQITEAE